MDQGLRVEYSKRRVLTQRWLALMELEMPERTIACDQCGQPARQSFGEGGMGWYVSFHCDECGQTYEADGYPPTPDEFRKLILQIEGEWVLSVSTKLSVESMKALRSALSLSVLDMQQLRNRLPGEIRRGTKYEMTQILNQVHKVAPTSNLVVRPLGKR